MGNPAAVKQLRDWAEAWRKGPPKERALILAGDPGCGKTTAALALAREFGWGVVELNASDARNAAAIEGVALRGAIYETFAASGEFKRAAEGYRKLIILDEADSLVERVAGGRKLEKDLSDRGGKPAIVRTLKETGQPVILIVNDLYALTKGSGGPLKKLARTIKFRKLQPNTIRAVLAGVCRNEGVEADAEALALLAEKAGGDMRAALNDLQGLAEAGPITSERVGWLGSRDSVEEMFNLLSVTFKATDYATPRRAAINAEENPESIALWIDDNLPLAYTDPYDLLYGYHWLSRADLFLGRVRRRQYYGFWGYASELSTSGVALAKKGPLRGYPRYQFPSWLRKMGASRGRRNQRDAALRLLAAHCHSARDTALTQTKPLLTTLLNQPLDDEGAHPGAKLVADMRLEEGHLAYLLGVKPEDRQVRELLEQAKVHGWGPLEKLRGEQARAAMGQFAGSKAPPADKKKPAKAKDKAKKRVAVAEKSPATDDDEPAAAGEEGEAAPPPAEEKQKTLFDF